MNMLPNKVTKDERNLKSSVQLEKYSSDMITNIIRQRILFLEYQPGKILNEKSLADEFKVSRTPVREALLRLEWEQLVRIIARTGALVTVIDLQKMMHVFNIRFEIEALIGSLAAEHINEDQLNRILKIKEDCSRLLSNKDSKAFVNIDLELRKVLYSAVNNPVLSDISQYLYNLTLRVWYTLSYRGDWAEEVHFMMDEIDQTYEVLSTKNPQESARVRRQILINYINRVKNKFSSAILLE